MVYIQDVSIEIWLYKTIILTLSPFYAKYLTLAKKVQK